MRPAGTVPAIRASKSQTRRCTLAFAMSFARLSLSLAGVVGVIAAALAAATIWLIMTQPVTVADAVAQGEVSPLVKALAGVLYDALQGLMKYL
jgi:multidrug resistance efflux pump